MQYLPGWTVQCINPECAARGHWLRADQLQSELWSEVAASVTAQPNPVSALVLSGMNDVLNSEGLSFAKIPSASEIVVLPSGTSHCPTYLVSSVPPE